MVFLKIGFVVMGNGDEWRFNMWLGGNICRYERTRRQADVR
jgi:hypothetical protein